MDNTLSTDSTPKILTPFSRWMTYLGFPVGIALFLIIYYIPTPTGISGSGQVCLGAFLMALVWWTTSTIPTYLSSIILIVFLVLFNGWGQKEVLSVLGLEVIWLYVMSFVLGSMMIKTNLAKRVVLKLVLKFGNKPGVLILALVGFQIILASMIPSAAIRTVTTLPIILLVISLYGEDRDKPNIFGKILLLTNLHSINIGSAGFMTGSLANLIGVAFILGMSGGQVSYADWFFGNAPIVVIASLFSWWGARKVLFRGSEKEKCEAIEVSLEVIEEKYKKLGPMRSEEWRAIAIFGGVFFLWMTEALHTAWFGVQISPVMAAAIGAVVAMMPRIGVIEWGDAEIPWHLIIFGVGVYASGMSLQETGVLRNLVGRLLDFLGITSDFGFWKIYIIVIVLGMFSHVLFTRKMTRALVMIPIVITVAQVMGYPVLALVLPAAFTISWTNSIETLGKSNMLFSAAGKYSVADSIKAGVYITIVGACLYIIAGFTWFKWLGIMEGTQ